MSDTSLADVAGKLWSVGRLLIPGVAIFELVSWGFSTLWSLLSNYVQSKIDLFWNLIKSQIDVLGVDLTPSGEFLGFLAKANSVVPLSEMWSYFLLYLGVASVVLGVKWARNLIPTIS